MAYTLLAVDFLPPSKLRQLLCTMADSFNNGRLRGVSTVAHPLARTSQALKQLSQARSGMRFW